MRRLANLLLNVMTMLSFIAFCLTTLFLLSMLSELPGNSAAFEFANWTHHVYAGRGLVNVNSMPARIPSRWLAYVSPQVDQWHAIGFSVTVNHFPGWRLVEIGIPFWFLLLATGVLPGRALIRRCRRPGIGHCATCGYDLRATPDRCPECGAIPTIPATISN